MAYRPKQTWPKINNPLTQENIREWLSYDSKTGKLFWRKHIKPYMVGDEATQRSRSFGEPARYGNTSFFGKGYGTHRLIWIYHHGEIAPGLQIDHQDGDTKNNRIENLRIVNSIENNRNSSSRQDNISGITGVNFCGKTSKWISSIGVGEKSIIIGRYESKEHAIIARKAAERVIEYHPNHGRTKKVLESA